MKKFKLWFLMRLIRLCIRLQTNIWLEELNVKWHRINNPMRFYCEEQYAVSCEGQRITVENIANTEKRFNGNNEDREEYAEMIADEFRCPCCKKAHGALEYSKDLSSWIHVECLRATLNTIDCDDAEFPQYYSTWQDFKEQQLV